MLRRVELGALGYGKNHPAMIGLEAKVASCPREVEVPADLCGEALLQRQALELTGAGTNHPAVLAANAMLSVCRKPIRVTRKQCGSIAKWRSHLVSNGLGERHPDVVAAEARLAACTAARKLSPPVPGRAHLILRGGSGDYTASHQPELTLRREQLACHAGRAQWVRRNTSGIIKGAAGVMLNRPEKTRNARDCLARPTWVSLEGGRLTARQRCQCRVRQPQHLRRAGGPRRAPPPRRLP